MEQQLIMVRRTLDDLAEAPTAPGYAIRFYHTGDEEHLEPVFQECFDPGWSADRVCKTFLEDPFWTPNRMCILTTAADEVVGTATAWEACQRPNHGLVHYVGVLPAHRGRSLGKALVVRVLELLREIGYRDAWLSTDDFRLPAISVYLDLGFEPVCSEASHRDRWEIVRHKLVAHRGG